MSDQLFTEIARPTVRVGNKSWKTIPLSVAAHAVAIFTLIVVPLLATGMVPTPNSVLASVVIPPPPPQVPPPAPPRTPQPVEHIIPNAAPPEEPSRITPEREIPPPTMTGYTTGDRGFLPGLGTLGGTSLTPPPAPPTPPAPPVPQGPVRPGGQIKEPSKIVHVRPIYPQIAITARVEGRVIIEATIGKDGSVVDAKVLRSIPLLDQAALEAVRQWKFTPTLLNGTPVPVLMTVTVDFSLR